MLQWCIVHYSSVLYISYQYNVTSVLYIVTLVEVRIPEYFIQCYGVIVTVFMGILRGLKIFKSFMGIF